MSKIKSVNSLNLSQAIEKAVLQLHANFTGFFLHTEFGDIGIEVRKRMTGVLHWTDAPATKFVMDNRKVNCDYYIGIQFKEFQKHEVTEFFITGFLVECMLRSLYKEMKTGSTMEPSMDVVYAASLACVEHVTHSSYNGVYTSPYSLAELMCEWHYPAKAMRIGRMYNDLLEARKEVYNYRLGHAREYIDVVRALATSAGFRKMDYSLGIYYEFLAGLIIQNTPSWDGSSKYITGSVMQEAMNNCDHDLTPYKALCELIKFAELKANGKVTTGEDSTAIKAREGDGKKKGGKK